MAGLLTSRLGTGVGIVIIGLTLGACAGDDAESAGAAVEVPATYTFESRAAGVAPGTSSVSYSGQTARHLLISDLGTAIAELDAAIDSAALQPATSGDVVARLDFFYRFDSESDGTTEHRLDLTPPAKQTTHADVSSGKDLDGKLAGNDPKTDHVDWNAPGAFRGWSDPSIAQRGGSIGSPAGLVQAFFWALEWQAILRADGQQAAGPNGEALPVYVTADGLDLRQLLLKFLLGAVTYSQGTDDYLDDDVPDKGLLSSNVRPSDGTPYSPLEHAWDEAFGYFGAARDYADYTDDEIAAADGRADWQGYHDSNGDGAIDLGSEYNVGAAVNAAKRDRGSSAEARTDFSGQAFAAFLAGRTLIASAEGELTDAQLTELKGYRDAAVAAWEAAIAATIAHYINEVLADMDAFGTADYDFEAHAKHWSELKGFALGLQFNPRSRLSADELAASHTLLGDRPVLAAAGEEPIAAYRGDLLEVRSRLETAYGFAPANASGW